MADKKVKVTLIKSTIGAVPKNKKTIEALGLSKLYKTVELPDNAATQGALRKVAPSLLFFSCFSQNPTRPLITLTLPAFHIAAVSQFHQIRIEVCESNLI